MPSLDAVAAGRALARQISAGRQALYVCGETFGGPGTQEAIGWRDGVLLSGPSGTCDLEAELEPGYHLASRGDSAINVGLRALGVIAAPGMDEFETAGLARHRFTSDWLTSWSAPPITADDPASAPGMPGPDSGQPIPGGDTIRLRAGRGSAVSFSAPLRPDTDEIMTIWSKLAATASVSWSASGA